MTSHCENPDWVSAHAIAVAVPMISMTAPVSESVSTRSGINSAPIELAVDQQAEQRGVDDAHGGDLGGGGDAVDDRGADYEWQCQTRVPR